MKKQRLLFITFLLTNVFYATAQRYAVNDVVANITPDTFLQTQPVSGERVVFIEKKFTLKVSKADLIHTLEAAARDQGGDSQTIFNTVIAYLSSTDKLMFKNIWTKADAIDELDWSEAERSDPKTLAAKLIKENLCDLIEQGKFELLSGGKKQDKVFTGLVDTHFGKNAKGVFTTGKRLIWICPPWVVCALPPF